MNEKAYYQKDSDCCSIPAYQLLTFRTGNERKQTELRVLSSMYEHIYIVIIFISLIYLTFIYPLNLTLIKALTILFLILINQVLRNIVSFQHIILQDLFRRQAQKLKIDFKDLLISHCAYLKIPQSQHKISMA